MAAVFAGHKIVSLVAVLEEGLDPACLIDQGRGNIEDLPHLLESICPALGQTDRVAFVSGFLWVGVHLVEK